jgi:hypothetical protein
MLAGAWAAWRKSPLYSVKITLKLIGVTLSIVALILGAEQGVAQLQLPPNVLVVLLLAMVVVVGTGATVLIIRITDSHVARLPASVRIVTTHRQKVHRWIFRLFIFLFVCAAAGLVLPGSWRTLPWGVGGFVLLGCGPALAGFEMRARRLDLGMSQVLALPWVHWQFTPAQWQAWATNQLEWERSQVPPFSWHKDGAAYLKKGAMLGLIFVACSLLEVPGGFAEKLWVSAAFTVGFMLLILWINWFNRRYCYRRYRHLLAAPPEVYFGDEGFFASGQYSQWIFSGSYLTAAKVASHPPALVLVFQRFDGSSSVQVAQRIPIPEGRASDLDILQQKLRVACPKAAIHLGAPAAAQ